MLVKRLNTETQDFRACVRRAKLKAREERVPYVVAEIDTGPCRALKVFPEAFVLRDEFVAFEGEVLVIVEPDGSVDI